MTRKFLRSAPLTCCLTFALTCLSLSVVAQAQGGPAPGGSAEVTTATPEKSPASEAKAPATVALTAPAADPPREASDPKAPADAAGAKDSDVKDAEVKDSGASAEATPTPTPEAGSPGAATAGETPTASGPPATPPAVQEVAPNECRQTIKADVVALDQPYMLNRLGAAMPQGMIFALKRDVIPNTVGIDDNGNDKTDDVNSKAPCLNRPGDFSCLEAGKVRLRSSKRARPLVLRLNAKDCLEITFKNLLMPLPPAPANLPVKTRNAGVHLQGLQLISATGPLGGPGINSDASFVGVNPNAPTAGPGTIGSYAAPNKTLVYKYYAADEGTFLISSGAGDENGQLQAGLFGAVNVEPEGAEYYRSQVTREDLQLSTFTDDNLPTGRTEPIEMFLQEKLTPQRAKATARVEDKERQLYTLTTVNKIKQTVQTTTVIKVPVTVRIGTWSYGPKNYLYVYEPTEINSNSAETIGHPVINYNALYPATYPLAGRRCTPILRMADTMHQCGNPEDFYLKREDEPLGDQISLNLYHSDLTAIITGPNADRFPYTNVSPTFRNNPASPDRRQPYREFTIHYHNPSTPAQAFSQWVGPDAQLKTSYNAVRDLFAINYGTGGIGAEIVSNRLGVGPAGGFDAVEMKFEEFFLSAWAVGDPAMVVDIPANYTRGSASVPCGQNTLQAGTQVTPPPTGKCVAQVTTNPPPGPKATKALYPDDPSNVYHSYMGDHTKFRILHAGVGANHVHHLHAHQWLHSPNNDNSSYLDSQMINPGSAYTLEIAYNGSGNRNKTVGDSIFHCHFYPHFAQGMWSLWRVHDVFEAGTKLNAAGQPVTYNDMDENGERYWNRALPDAEIVRGTPIPAVVPLPTIGMALIPAKVRLTVPNDPDASMKLPQDVWDKLKALWGTATNVPDQWMSGRRVVVKTSSTSATPFYTRNPGFPFFIPGVAGHRPPHPPMDFGWVEVEAGKPAQNPDGSKVYLDGGLPRHLILGGSIFREFHTRWDFTKDFVLYGKDKMTPCPDPSKPPCYGMIDGALIAFQLPETGTAIEESAMRSHARRTTATVLPDGDPGTFILNGLPPAPGAPYSDPSVDDNGNSTINTRRYKAAAIQTDTVFNKKGWHYPQQRMLTLMNDAADVWRGAKPPEPFFFRSNTGETIEFWHTNLVPNYYEMDDFQVRTPTDIIGQHIHLVKFDVTSSDGAANGWNYEDGTFSSDEVRERVFALNRQGGLYQFNPRTQFVASQQTPLRIKKFSDSYAAYVPPGFTPPPEWDGAQTTIQRFDTDPLLNNEGVDRTLRTVFTHDHYGPSTHQQVGLYGGMLIEPEGSKWYDATTGRRLYSPCKDEQPPRDGKCSDGTLARDDGGPTTWQAVIETANESDSYREFALEFQDMQLAYTAASMPAPATPPATASLFTIGTSVSAVVAELNAAPAGSAPAPGDCATPNTPNVGNNTKAAFSNSGVTLSAKAYAINTGTSTTPSWAVIDPEPQPATSCDLYKVTSTGTGSAQKLPVFYPTMHPGWSDAANAINPTGAGTSPNVISGSPNPSSAGAYSLNYRSEPLPLRVATPVSGTPQASDLGFAFTSMARGDASLNAQPGASQLLNPACTGADCFKFPQNQLIQGCPPDAGSSAATAATSGCPQGTDPYTPMLRAYAGDRVQIRTLVGAHLVGHPLRIHGFRWHPEPSISNSGFVSAQGMGLSEHFEMIFTVPTLPPPSGAQNFADYLYEPSGGTDGLVNGLWGIFRAYTQPVANLKELPGNDVPNNNLVANVGCPAGLDPSAVKTFNVTAVSAQQALVTPPNNGAIVYNSRVAVSLGADPNALLYVRSEDLNGTLLKFGVPVEPLILRANAGDCIRINLTNGLPTTLNSNPITASSFTNSPFGRAALPDVTMNVSTSVGLSPQLVTHNIKTAGGTNIGFNPTQTVAPGNTAPTFEWYAGIVSPVDGTATPVEFGAVNLLPTDPLIQHTAGLVGALIIEPQGATWIEDAGSRASAVVMMPDKTSFREQVLVFQNDIFNNNAPVQAAFNYRTEPFSFRFPNYSANPSTGTDTTPKFSDSLLTPNADPQTPVFSAAAGSPTRIRLVFPGGYNQLEVFDLHGHTWQEQPFVNDSTGIGFNRLSQAYGGYLLWPFQASNILLPNAGGRNGSVGDYVYSSFNDAGNNGTWGIFRVSDEVVLIQKAVVDGQNNINVGGAIAVKQGVTTRPNVTVYAISSTGTPTSLGMAAVQPDGTWRLTGNMSAQPGVVVPGTNIIAMSSNSPSACTLSTMQNPFTRCITGKAQMQAATTALGQTFTQEGGGVTAGGGGGSQRR